MPRRCLLWSIPLIVLPLIAAACDAPRTPVNAPPTVPAQAAQPAPSQSALMPSIAAPTIAAAEPTTAPSIAPATPTLTPTLSPAPNANAARLPTDQTWLRVGDSRLVAIDRSGALTEYTRSVTALIERPGGPPLLATSADDGTPAIVDPLHWTEIRLALKPGDSVHWGLLSPDGKHVLLQVGCTQGAQCGADALASNQIADLQTGATQPLGSIPVPYSTSGPYGSSMGVSLLGWGAKGIYYGTDYSRAGGTTLDVSDPADTQHGTQELLRNTSYALNYAKDILVAVYSSPSTSIDPSPFEYSGEMSMVLSDLRKGSKQTIDRATSFTLPAIAPDGTALAYFRIYQDQSDIHIPPHIELVLFDIAQNTKTVLSDTLGMPFEIYTVPSGNHATFWSQDSQRIIATAQSQQGEQAWLLARDGTPINTVPLPWGGVLGVTDDDQLALALQDGHLLHWLPLRPNAAPYSADVTLTDMIFSIALLPPGNGTAPAPSPAARTPPPATQLPTPALPTQVPSAPAAVARLGELPGDAQLVSELPVYQHVLYRVGGALYSQSLRGGPAVSLGGGQGQDWNSPVFISSDGDYVIEQRRDGVYRAPTAGGAAVRLTPPLASGDPAFNAFASVSTDGHRLLYTLETPVPAAWKDQLRDSRWSTALYSLPIAGGTPVRLTPPLDPDSKLWLSTITPDSRQVVYGIAAPDPNLTSQADTKIGTSFTALYSVPLEGGTPVRLVEVAGLEDRIGNWQVTPDGRYVLYQKRNFADLYSVPVAGGAPVRLGAPDRDQVIGFSISPDNRYVLYTTGSGLYAVSIASGTVMNLTSAITPLSGVYGQQFTPDSAQVVFRTDNALYQAPSSGGPAVALRELPGSVDTQQFGVLALNDRVIYQDGNAIYSIPLAGGAPTELAAAPDLFDKLYMEQLSPDARYVVYRVEQITKQARSIYCVPIAGGPPALLFAGAADHTTFHMFSGDYAIGLSDSALYAAPLAGGLPLKLAATEPAGLPIVSADGRQVVYVVSGAGGSAASTQTLYVATLEHR